MQLNHESVPFVTRQFPITLVCDSIVFQPNIGSLFRICEAFGVEKIIFLGIGNQMNHRKINKTSRNTHLHVPYQLYETKEEVMAFLIENEYEIIALEITSNSIPIENIEIEKNKKIALLIGNEIEGVSDCFLKKSHQITHIEMFGKNSSMNVVQATGIALYELTRKMR
ncbi:23S rRNA methyltransferase [Flavobacterium sp. 9R]|uniref:TrmH family RNA methyltransferase n=1 Tax=Flavobacterium sp. 9R TaxID=2653143 RepID=UPI0012F3B3C0|nr:TrmH family RNA methyltransferase [Flavobacterium sp. 9R]VXB83539.1 23S rRNA methyltransferase [Flavobacterium sp. 9R]